MAQLGYQNFDICLEEEPQVGTPIHRILVEAVNIAILGPISVETRDNKKIFHRKINDEIRAYNLFEKKIKALSSTSDQTDGKSV